MEKFSFADWQSVKKPPKGWDCADAVDDGWGRTELDAYMRATVMTIDEWHDYLRAEWPEVAAEFGLIPPPAALKPAGQTSQEVIQQIRTVQQQVSSQPTARLPFEDALQPVGETPALAIKREGHGGAPVLDPSNPMFSARQMMADRYTTDGLPTLQHWRGGFYEWAGSRYRELDKGAVAAAVWGYLDRADSLDSKGNVVPFKPIRPRVDNVSAALAAQCVISGHEEAPAWVRSIDAMPPASELTPVANGLLHLVSGTLYPHTPAYFNLNAAGVDFDPNAPEPVEWLKFLDQIWGDDKQSIETLQDVFGYLLSPDTSQQKIPLIVGPKRSGKGTIARVLTGLLGQESVCAPTLSGLSTNFGVEPLIGKSVAIIGDARLGGRADQAAIAERLLQISGEDSLTVDRKHKSAWTGKMSVRFVIMSNELPRLSDASGALSGRFIVLTMENSFFGREDRGLLNRLLPELPGILNWARAGYLRLNKRGYFEQPETAKEAIGELEALGSPISAFIKDRCATGPGKQCLPAQLFEAWKGWCTENGRKEPGTLQSFARDLRATVPGLRTSRPRVGGLQVLTYEGVALHSSGIEVPGLDSDW